METHRIEWRRAETGFSADLGHGKAMLIPGKVHGQWLWSIRIGEATANGQAVGRQAASDDANAALPVVERQAALLAREAEHKAKVREQIDRMGEERDPDVATTFQIEAASYENLMFIMDQVKGRRRSPGVAKIIDVISREFFRRRA